MTDKPCVECNGTGVLTRLGGDWGTKVEHTVPCWRCQNKTCERCGQGPYRQFASEHKSSCCYFEDRAEPEVL